MEKRLQLKQMNTQNKRTTGKEQYYTPNHIAKECVRVMKRYVSSDVIWLEPAGGTGAFIEALLEANIEQTKIISFDIEPKHSLVKQTYNFLNEDVTCLASQQIVTLTNPPFGRCNSLCVPFFNKCANVSTHIGFIVPKSWRKWSVINKLHKNFHLVYDEELKIDYIREADTKSNGNLKTVFQIWQRKETVREKLTAENRGYIQKSTPENADVSLTVFGRGCGNVKTDFKRVNNTTQMFLKTQHPWVLQALQSVNYNKYCDNVAFIQALSTAEIYSLLNEWADTHNSTKLYSL